MLLGGVAVLVRGGTGAVGRAVVVVLDDGGAKKWEAGTDRRLRDKRLRLSM